MDGTLAALARRAITTLETAGLWEAAAAACAQLARLHDPLTTVAVLGEFKRGKSSLVNALVDRTVLPVGVLPLTAVRTVVETSGDESSTVEVRYPDGRREALPIDAIGRYATEEDNPGNRLGVAEVHVRVADRALGGVRLIDTPGLASPFADTAAAAEPAAADADVAVVVLAADQPASREELELLERTAPAVPTVVVVNRMDVIAENDRERVLRFTTEQVERVAAGPMHVIGVSARGATEGVQAWRRGIDDLRTAIRDSAHHIDRAARVRTALHDLLAAAVPQAALRHRTLTLKKEARAAYDARRMRNLELAVTVAWSRIHTRGGRAADAIIAALGAAEEPAAVRTTVTSAVRAAATCAVRAGREPGAAAHAALGCLLGRWSAAETRALGDALPVAEAQLRAAVRDVIREEDGSETLVPDMPILLPPLRVRLAPLAVYRSVLPGSLGRWRVLKRFCDDVGHVVDAALEARRAALEATVRSAVDVAVRSIVDRMLRAGMDDGHAPPTGDPTDALRGLLVELEG